MDSLVSTVKRKEMRFHNGETTYLKRQPQSSFLIAVQVSRLLPKFKSERHIGGNKHLPVSSTISTIYYSDETLYQQLEITGLRIFEWISQHRVIENWISVLCSYCVRPLNTSQLNLRLRSDKRLEAILIPNIYCRRPSRT